MRLLLSPPAGTAGGRWAGPACGCGEPGRTRARASDSACVPAGPAHWSARRQRVRWGPTARRGPAPTLALWHRGRQAAPAGGSDDVEPWRPHPALSFLAGLAAAANVRDAPFPCHACCQSWPQKGLLALKPLPPACSHTQPRCLRPPRRRRCCCRWRRRWGWQRRRRC